MPLGELKLHARTQLLQKSARESAAFFSNEIVKAGGAADSVIINPKEKTFRAIVDAYDREVDRFKKAHRFPEGHRINNSKIAALLVRVLVRDGIDDVFVIPNEILQRKGIGVAVGTYFVWHLTCAILAINHTKLPKDFRRDFMAAIFHCDDPSPELMCLSMSAIRTAFGDPSVNLQD